MTRLERDLRRGETLAEKIAGGALLILAASLVAGPAAAVSQPGPDGQVTPRTIEIGQPPIISQIDEGDPSANGQHYEAFSLRLTEGDRIRIDMERVSDGSATQQRVIDPYLLLMAPHNNEDVVARNDDRAPNFYDARIIYTAEETATFVIRARGFGATTGAYRLSVTRLPPPIAARPIEGDRATGSFNAESPVDTRAGGAASQYEYLIQGNAGDRVALDLDAPEIDAVLELVDADGQELATSNDFSDAALRPRLFVVLQDNRPHRLRIRAPLDQHGAYTLTVNRMAPPTRMRERDEFQGERETDRLTLSSQLELVPGSRSRIAFFYRIYRVRVRPNEPIVVTLESTDFDPVLDAGRDSVIGYALAASDNDGGGGFNSRLELHPVAPGVVHLRVRSRDPAVGEFTVRVFQAGAAPPPQDEAAP
jgi:hypothetical protein